MELSIWIPKGGTGKTMLATTLAGYLAEQGARVLVVDQDPQSGSLVWARRAARAGQDTPFVVAAARSRGFDIVLYDHAPVPPQGGLPGQLVIMPTLLDGTTHPLYMRGKQILEERLHPFVVVPSRVRPDRSEQRQLLGCAFAGLPIVRDRAIYPNAYGRGLTIYSQDLKLPHAALARAEFDLVAQHILGQLKEVRHAA